MNKNHGLNNRGYIGVVSAIIVTAIVIVVSLVFSSSNFLGRFDAQSHEFKDVARNVAGSCLEYARLKLAQGSYGGNEILNVGSYSCNILPIEAPAGQKIIKSTATVNKRTVNLKLTVDAATLKTISLEELNSF